MPVVDGAPAGVLCFEQHQMPQFCQYDGRRRMPKIMEAHSTSTAPHATVAGLFLGRVQSHDFATAAFRNAGPTCSWSATVLILQARF